MGSSARRTKMDKPSTTTPRLLTHCIPARVLYIATNSLIEFMARGFLGLFGAAVYKIRKRKCYMESLVLTIKVASLKVKGLLYSCP